jgi:drug/metabolite transporter (DMT)-like permease
MFHQRWAGPANAWPKFYKEREIEVKKEKSMMWLVFALGSAVFAALTSILAKVGIDGVNSNLATAIRTCVVVLLAWGMVFLTHAQPNPCPERIGIRRPISRPL